MTKSNGKKASDLDIEVELSIHCTPSNPAGIELLQNKNKSGTNKTKSCSISLECKSKQLLLHTHFHHKHSRLKLNAENQCEKKHIKNEFSSLFKKMPTRGQC